MTGIAAPSTQTSRKATLSPARPAGTWLVAVALLVVFVGVTIPQPSFAKSSSRQSRASYRSGSATPSAKASGKYAVTKKQGDYLLKNMKVWIKATNSKFTSLNYKRASTYMGGTKFWQLKRRQSTAYWYYVGKKVTHISAAEQKIIVQTYWPTPPADCETCLQAAGHGVMPKSALMFEQNGYKMTATLAHQVLLESAGRVRLRTSPSDERDSPCTGTTKTVDLGSKGYDAYYDSCDTDEILRWLGYGSTACAAIFGSGSLKSIVDGAKKAAEDKGLAAAAALLGAICWIGTTSGTESITDAQTRSNKNAVIKQVRKLGYAPYPPPGHYLTNSRWVSQ